MAKVQVGKISVNNALSKQFDQSEMKDYPDFNLMPDTLLQLDKTGIIRYANRIPTWGTKKNFIGSHFLDYILNDDCEKVAEILENIYRTGRPQVFEFRSKDSSPWYSVSAGLINDNNNMQSILISLRDISHLKVQNTDPTPELDLAESLIETAQAIVLILDTEGRIVKFNPYLEEISGYKLEQIKGKDWFETFIPENEKSRVKKIFKNSLSDHPVRGNINPIITRNKEEKLIEWYDKLLKDRNGNVIGLLAIGHDITERIKTEEALRTSEAQLSIALKIAHLGYWEYDVKEDLFYFNDHFYSIFKTSSDKVGGYTMSPEQYAKTFLHPDDAGLVGEEVKKSLTIKDPNFQRQLEHRIKYADGSVGYISVRYFVVKDKQGRTIRTFGANQDITQQKEVEKKLEEQNREYQSLNRKLKESLKQLKQVNRELEKAKLKAEESDKLKSAFLANMSHEIRTPMNGIIGFSKMLNRPNLSDERKKQYTEIINEMCRQLLNLINDIIDISKIETGQIKILLGKCNLNDLLFHLYSFYKPLAAKNKINLYMQKVLRDDQADIETDSAKLRQILDNLLSNALKFTHNGYVKFGYHALPDKIEFFVEDTGIGIAKNLHEKIFNRFTQAQNQADKIYGGTGLGLSICKAYVEKLGGEIWVNSFPGRGSGFFFNLPIKWTETQKREAINQNDKQKTSDKSTILVVEDEDYNYLYIEEVLLDLQVNILHAKSGKEAVELSKKHPDIQLILMDIKLPDFNGFEALKQIKTILPNVPAIAQTAYALSGDKEIALEMGFTDYIAKPIDDIELVSKVQQFISETNTN